MNALRRLLGLRYVRVITDVTLSSVTLPGGADFIIKGMEYRWVRVRPWWKVWA